MTQTAGTEELGPSSHVEVTVHKDCNDDDDEDACNCEINANDHYRLCKAGAVHNLVLSTADAFLVKKPLSATAAPHLRSQSLITKLDVVAKVVGLDVPTILREQLKDPVLSVVGFWIQGSIFPDLKAPEIRQSERLLRYGQELDRLLIEEHGQLLFYDEPFDTLDEKNYASAFLYDSIWPVFEWDNILNWVDTWELQMRMLTLKILLLDRDV